MIQSLQWDDLVETACARQPRWTPGGSDSGEWAHSSPGLTETEKSLGQPSCGMEADSSLCGRHLLTCMRRENVWHQSAKLKLEVGWIYRFEGIPAGTGQSGGLGPPDLPVYPAPSGAPVASPQSRILRRSEAQANASGNEQSTTDDD